MTDEELAALFAEKVLGWRREPTWATWLDEDGRYPMWRRPWQPCTDLNQAMLGVEGPNLRVALNYWPDAIWTVAIYEAEQATGSGLFRKAAARDEKLARAIVKARLGALEHPVRG